MAFDYRFSIIPPGAITDRRVTPNALRVLCLLGRHIDNGGWCTRSQVKMARELGCSRSAVQEACDVLVETGWAEKRRNGRGGTGPETSAQPFAAYSYRVRLDRADDGVVAAPAVSSEPAAEAPPAPTEPPEGGAAPAAGGAAPAAGGAAPAAPLEGISSEGISSEVERDPARAREHDEFARWLSAFTLRWPTAAADDQSRIANAGRALTRDQRRAALDKIPEFLAHLAKIKRSHPPAGWRYLEELRWEKLPGAGGKAASGSLSCLEGSTQWIVWAAVYRIARPRGGIPHFRVTGAVGQRRLWIMRELPDAMAALAAPERRWRDVTEGTANYAAWHRWLGGLMPANLIEHRSVGDARSLNVPAPFPPRVDGSLSPENDHTIVREDRQ